jgi:CRP-like cAMP-binding protein
MTRETDLFAGLAADDVAALAALASAIPLEAGGILFRIGQEATNLYVVEDGLIELTMPMRVGGRDENVCVDERLTGQALGWSTLVPPHRFTLDATARVASRLLAFPRDRLLAFFTERPDVGLVVLRNVAALVGQRLQVSQAMWLRQMQHMVNHTHA